MHCAEQSPVGVYSSKVYDAPSTADMCSLGLFIASNVNAVLHSVPALIQTRDWCMAGTREVVAGSIGMSILLLIGVLMLGMDHGRSQYPVRFLVVRHVCVMSTSSPAVWRKTSDSAAW